MLAVRVRPCLNCLLDCHDACQAHGPGATCSCTHTPTCGKRTMPNDPSFFAHLSDTVDRAYFDLDAANTALNPTNDSESRVHIRLAAILRELEALRDGELKAAKNAAYKDDELRQCLPGTTPASHDGYACCRSCEMYAYGATVVPTSCLPHPATPRSADAPAGS